MAKILITSNDSDLNSSVSAVFGRCPYFLIVDEKGKLEKAIPNTGVQAVRGAGIAAAQTVVSQGATVVITGNVGPNAFAVLQQSGVKLYNGVGMTAKEALESFKENKLTEITTSAGRFGGRGAGQGPGRGMGGGMGGGRRV
ncbi:NifB/NifX family molybdenum-iron cluster-binding protein [Candidatus Parcubacteria bacterium]|nr:NifB/NifX family molybdenum-iron cluster-binding protein [Candidatus Parcubacteria bacterium]